MKTLAASVALIVVTATSSSWAQQQHPLSPAFPTSPPRVTPPQVVSTQSSPTRNGGNQIVIKMSDGSKTVMTSQSGRIDANSVTRQTTTNFNAQGVQTSGRTTDFVTRPDHATITNTVETPTRGGAPYVAHTALVPQSNGEKFVLKMSDDSKIVTTNQNGQIGGNRVSRWTTTDFSAKGAQTSTQTTDIITRPNGTVVTQQSGRPAGVAPSRPAVTTR
jgi:hypothetical protein